MPPNPEKNRDDEYYYSTLGIKVHKSRSDYFQVSGDVWLEEKGNNDGAEGLWRIHDDIYDLSDFILHHPGGSQWLTLTKGTDITEAFEAHHINLGPSKLLPKFQVRKAQTPRNSPFTFEENGFYRQLKHRVRDALKTVPDSATRNTRILTDSLLAVYIVTAILAAKYMCYIFGTIAGMTLAMLTIAAHNYLHHRDCFRMYYFDFSIMSSRDWRISHALSHHLYPNTIIDMELQLFEPLLQFLPRNKSFLYRYGAWFYCPLYFVSMFGTSLIRRMSALLKGETDKVGKRFIIPFTIPILMYIFGGQSILSALLMWIYIICVGSFHFALVGTNAAHQRPDIFHDGDAPRGKKIDWGISQLDTVMDRYDITGSLFLVLTNFGDHGLHHLFPTIDHGKLQYLYPILEDVCKKFNVELRMTSQLDMIVNTFKQMANVTPNPIPPGYNSNKNK